MTGARRLPAGSRSQVWRLPGPAGAVVVKLAPAPAVAREANALAQVAALALAPAVVAVGAGVLVTEALAGATLPAASWGAERARALGAMIARLHRALPAAAGHYDGWSDSEGDLAAYRRRRAGGAPQGLALPAADAVPSGEDGFVQLHGDLWSGNIVWQERRPTLVDWEFLRPGDPAEELAYLAAMDDLDPATLAALIAGYAPADPTAFAAAIAWWRPLLAAECAAWFAAEGDHDRARALTAQAEAPPPV